MPRCHKLLAPLLCLFGLASTAQAGDSAYLIALDKELANRAVARQVVPQLAERHSGSDQGRFWSAYAKLEALQQPRYAKQAERHGLANNHSGGFKAHASLLFAKLFNGAFIKMLAGATDEYLQELEALPAQTNADDQAFWDYVIAQERAQVEALALAAQKNFNAATRVLQAFSRERLGSE
ncbi:hypothetical protein [Pseudomonas yangonensis]|uniref:hypothetical protein n=1 Tax=Pseudomonas yangonensis TaxID=2579922 RepID=UPI00137A65CE|nr:hypothetical protein [Pseudomonas yangonensis]